MRASRPKAIPEPVVYLLIAAAAALLYANSVPAGFVCDDEGLILQCRRVHSLRCVPGYFGEAFAQQRALGQAAKYYRPVVSASFALDYAVGGPGRPWVFHLTNVLAYGACAALVYGVMRSLLLQRTPAVLGALLFAAMPVHTETVSWISGRTDIFALLFTCGAVLCLLRARHPRAGEYLPYVAAFILTLLALLSKEVALALLPLWIVFEVTWGDTRGLRAPFVRRAYAVAVVLLAVCAYVVMRTIAVGAMRQPTARFLDPATPTGLASMGLFLWHYLAKLVLPVHLSFGFEVEPFREALSLMPILCLVGGAALLGVSVYAAVKAPRTGFALWWIWLTLVPALNIVPITETTAERFLFVPSVGFCLLTALVLHRIRFHGRRLAGLAYAAVAALVASYALMSVVRNADWRQQRTLYLATVASSPLSPTSHAWAGQAYLSEPVAPERAGLHYGRLLALSAEKPGLRCLAHNAIGKLSLDLGDPDVAIRHLREALALNDEIAVIHGNLALAWRNVATADGSEKAWEASRAEAEAALRRDLHYPDAYYALGLYYLDLDRDTRRAAELLAKATELDPGFYHAQFALAAACLANGDLESALRAAERALTIEPTGEARALVQTTRLRINATQ